MTLVSTNDTDAGIASPDWCEISQAGVRFTRKPTWEEYAHQVELWQKVNRLSAWIIGDLVNYGENTFGEKYAQVMDMTGLSYGRIGNLAWTCRQVPMDIRQPSLSISHHTAVATDDLSLEERSRLLKEAAMEKMNREEFRLRIKQYLAPSQPEARESIGQMTLRQLVVAYIQAVEGNDEDKEELFLQLKRMVKYE